MLNAERRWNWRKILCKLWCYVGCISWKLEAGLRSFTLSTGPCEFHSKYLLWRTDCTPSSGQCPGALVRTTWSLVSQCPTCQPQSTADDQSLHSSWTNLLKHTFTNVFLLYHLIWSCSQYHLTVQIKTVVEAAQEHYKAEAGFSLGPPNIA